MDQKVSFDLIRLAGLLGFNNEARDSRINGQIEAVFDKLAYDVHVLLKSYQEIQDQNLQLKQQLRSYRCKESRPRDDLCNANDRNKGRQCSGKQNSSMEVAASASQTYSHSRNTLTGISRNVFGASCWWSGGSANAHGGRGGATRCNSPSVSSSGPLSQSPPIPVEDKVVAEAKQVLRNSGFELLEQIGHGGFGLVYNGRPLIDKISNTYPEVAIKFSRMDDVASWASHPVNGRRTPSEVEALLALNAVPSVVDLIGFGDETLGRDECSIIIMEKPASCLSFAKYLHRHKPLDESKAIFFLKQMAAMVLAIHQHGWVHTDLKPANLLVCAQDELKAIDFGLAVKHVNGECVVSSTGGTPLWNHPPEKLRGSFDLVKATVWSVGVTYYYMVFGKLPFGSLNRAYERPLRWHRPVSSMTRTIMQQLLNPDPVRRVDIHDIEKLIKAEEEKYRGCNIDIKQTASEPWHTVSVAAETERGRGRQASL